MPHIGAAMDEATLDDAGARSVSTHAGDVDVHSTSREPATPMGAASATPLPPSLLGP
jgi:hypothetical protein